MRPIRPWLALAALAVIAGCERSPYDPALDDVGAPVLGAAGSRAHAVSAVNWNIYIGADVDAVITALATPDPGDDIPALLTAIETLQRTDFPARAQAIADHIAKARPQVVGLQEVWEVAIDLRALGLPVRIDLDFLPIVQAALASRGLDYAVAARNTNTDAGPFPGIRVVDHDVLLVDRSRVSVLSAVERNFAANIGVVAPGVELLRGWVAIDAVIGGETYTIVNTHLESGAGAALSGLRALQAQELAASLAGASRVILMGDLNDGPGSPMYQVLLGAGLTDAWTALRPGVVGFTCCHAADLSDKVPQFDQRIDYVFTRQVEHPGGGPKGRIERLGEVPADRIPGPAHLIWPSDHVGLLVDFVSPPARGRR